MERWGIYAALRAASLMLAFFTVIAIFSASLRYTLRPHLLDFYRQSFSFTPGSRLGSRLVQARDTGRPFCIILGNSAAREGLDAASLDRAVPAYNFINAGTTGGNNTVFELQAAAIASNHFKPECSILAMDSWNLYAGGRRQIAEEDYLGLLDWRDVSRLSYRPMASTELLWISLGLGLPLKAQAKQINRSIRYRIFELRSAAGWPLPLARYEVFPGELRDEGQFLYAKDPNILLSEWNKLEKRSEKYYDPAIYGGSEERKSLAASLRILTSSSKRTFVVLLPQSPLLERASKIAMPSFLTAITPLRTKLTLVDCTGINNLKYFIDEGHLNAVGRREVTKAFEIYLQNTSEISTNLCKTVKL